MPTVKKNTPRSTPLKGSMATSIDFLYSVSASRIPATNAPSAMESPARLAATPVATTTNKVAAMKGSAAPVDATSLNSGLKRRRPATTISPSPRAAFAAASASAVHTDAPFCEPRMNRKRSSGATAKSWARRTERLVRPVAVESRP